MSLPSPSGLPPNTRITVFSPQKPEWEGPCRHARGDSEGSAAAARVPITHGTGLTRVPRTRAKVLRDPCPRSSRCNWRDRNMEGKEEPQDWKASQGCLCELRGRERTQDSPRWPRRPPQRSRDCLGLRKFAELERESTYPR